MKYQKVFSIKAGDLSRSDGIDAISGEYAHLTKICVQLNGVSKTIERYLASKQRSMEIDKLMWFPNFEPSDDGVGVVVCGIGLYALLRPQDDLIEDSLPWESARFRMHVLIAEFLMQSSRTQDRIEKVLAAQEKTRRRKPLHVIERNSENRNRDRMNEQRVHQDSYVYTSDREVSKHVVGCINRSLGLDEWYLNLSGTHIRLGARPLSIHLCSMDPIESTARIEVKDALVRAIEENDDDIWVGVDASVVELRKSTALLLVDQVSVLTGSFRIEAKNHGRFDKLKALVGKRMDFIYAPVVSRVLHAESSFRGGVLKVISKTVSRSKAKIPYQALRIDMALQYVLPLENLIPREP